MRAGIQRSFHLNPSHSFTAAIDAFFPQDNYSSLNAGLEYGFRKLFYLRTGYRNLFLKDNEGGPSAGVGFEFRNGQVHWMLDIAYSDYGVLHHITIFAVTINW